MNKALIFVMVFFCQQALAVTVCKGKVINVLQYASGPVNILTEYNDDYTVVCDVEKRRKGVSPAACKSMLSTLLTAQSTNKDIQVYYNENYPSCQKLPTYNQSPGPTYLGVMGRE